MPSQRKALNPDLYNSGVINTLYKPQGPVVQSPIKLTVD